MPVTPNTNTRGLLFTSVGDGSNRGTWDGGNSGALRVPASYAVIGPQNAATLPGFFVPVPAGQTVGLVAVIAVLSAGSCTVEVFQNGGGVAGLTAISVGTSSTGYVNPTTNPTPVADADYFSISISSPTGTGDLSFGLIFDLTP